MNLNFDIWSHQNFVYFSIFSKRFFKKFFKKIFFEKISSLNLFFCMKSIFPIIWLILNFCCFLLAILSFVFMFFDKRSSLISKDLSLIASIILNLTTSFFGLRITSNIGQNLLKRLLVNYSFHNGTTSMVFLITRIEPSLWIFALCLQCFYQFLNYLVIQILPRFREDNSTTNFLIYLYRKVSGQYRINLWVSLFELATLISIPQFIKNNSRIVISSISSFYIVWYLLYRYSSSRTHQIIWNYIYFLFVSFSGRVPTIIGTLILKFCLIFSTFGTKCCSIYQISNQPDFETADENQITI